MLFNSFSFLLFFPTICLLYFILPHRFRWVLLLAGSYYFYMNWQPVYALLLLGSTLITYGCALLIEKEGTKKRKKFFLVLSLLLNFGILFFFKYFNFINGSIFALLSHYNLRWEVPNLTLLLPVGISFYIFQAVGYSIDVYRGNLKAEKHFGIYAVFVSFFPQLVAGPIERAKNLLPQFYKVHHFEHHRVVQGLKLMLWGYFMKLVVADRLSLYVDSVYNNVEHHNGTSMLLATFFFCFQIYGDFAGYSYIAIGAAKVMGFNLMTNFNHPYFAKSISEFWGRWHISLSTWFRDYVYISLGGNRVSFPRWQLNLLITFLISGIWHGANWTFVFWGLLHGLFLIGSNSFKRQFPRMSQLLLMQNANSSFASVLGIATNFLLVYFAWIFFRANSLNDAFTIVAGLFAAPEMPYFGGNGSYLFYAFFGIILLMAVEYMREYYPRVSLFEHPKIEIRYSTYTVLVVIILMIGVFDGGQFIYFQF